MKSVIFLAPPAGGKGTLSDYLIKNYHYVHISTGDLLREEAKANQELNEILKSGKLVSDDIIMDLVSKKLKSLDSSSPFILDGVPRTLQQAKKLDIILTGRSDYVVVLIDVDKKILIDRVVGRKICPKCHQSYNDIITEFRSKVLDKCDACGSPLEKRVDDNLESFEVRYQEYESNNLPVVAFYEDKGCLVKISNNEVDQTNALKELRSAINEH